MDLCDISYLEFVLNLTTSPGLVTIRQMCRHFTWIPYTRLERFFNSFSCICCVV